MVDYRVGLCAAAGSPAPLCGSVLRAQRDGSGRIAVLDPIEREEMSTPATSPVSHSSRTRISYRAYFFKSLVLDFLVAASSVHSMSRSGNRMQSASAHSVRLFGYDSDSAAVWLTT